MLEGNEVASEEDNIKSTTSSAEVDKSEEDIEERPAKKRWKIADCLWLRRLWNDVQVYGRGDLFQCG